jgi:hypothetical protein
MRIVALVAILLGVVAIAGALCLVSLIAGLVVGGILLILVGAMAYTDGPPPAGVQTPAKRMTRRP